MGINSNLREKLAKMQEEEQKKNLEANALSQVNTQTTTNMSNTEKLEILEKEGIPEFDMNTIRDSVLHSDPKLLKTVKNKLKPIPKTISKEQLLKFETFIPESGNNYVGVELKKICYITDANSEFIRLTAAHLDVKQNALVNRILDVIRIHFNK